MHIKGLHDPITLKISLIKILFNFTILTKKKIMLHVSQFVPVNELSQRHIGLLFEFRTQLPPFWQTVLSHPRLVNSQFLPK